MIIKNTQNSPKQSFSPQFAIVAIDILDSKVARLTQGDYQQQKIYRDDPCEVLSEFCDQGAKHIHLVDLNAARNLPPLSLELLAQLIDTAHAKGTRLQLGGGIRDHTRLAKLFEVGLDFAIIGTQAIYDKDFLSQAINNFPNQIILSLDTRNNIIATNGWQQSSKISFTQYIDELTTAPVAIVQTDIAQDGMLQGPNFEQLSQNAKISPCPLIASGGVSSIADLQQLITIDNLCAAIVGKAIYENKITFADLIQFNQHHE